MERFLEIYDKVRNFRKNITAPVDTGCSSYAGNLDDSAKYKMLVFCILASRTTDLEVKKAMTKLEHLYNFSVEKISQLTESELKGALTDIGISFLDKKVVYIIETSKYIVKNGIPQGEKIAILPGIGEKSKNLIMNIIGEKKVVAIETHVERVLKRWGFVDAGTSIKAIGKKVNEEIPEKYRGEMNQIIVGFGQIVCSAKPKCETCSVRDLCPSADW